MFLFMYPRRFTAVHFPVRRTIRLYHGKRPLAAVKQPVKQLSVTTAIDILYMIGFNKCLLEEIGASVFLHFLLILGVRNLPSLCAGGHQQTECREQLLLLSLLWYLLQSKVK